MINRSNKMMSLVVVLIIQLVASSLSSDVKPRDLADIEKLVSDDGKGDLPDIAKLVSDDGKGDLPDIEKLGFDNSKGDLPDIEKLVSDDGKGDLPDIEKLVSDDGKGDMPIIENLASDDDKGDLPDIKKLISDDSKGDPVDSEKRVFHDINDCSDRERKCPQFAYVCDRSHVQYVRYAKKNCRKTCGYCGTGSKSTKVDGSWAAWSTWTPCTATCGASGQKTRMRTCTNPAPSGGGIKCTAVDGSQTRYCNRIRCPVTGSCKDISLTKLCKVYIQNYGCIDTRVAVRCPKTCGLCGGVKVDGSWAAWSTWTPCTATCGASGQKTRVRTCTNPAPSGGGIKCTAVDGSQTRDCNRIKCPVTGSCKDTNAACEIWKRKGFCKTMPIARKNCPKSCGGCIGVTNRVTSAPASSYPSIKQPECGKDGLQGSGDEGVLYDAINYLEDLLMKRIVGGEESQKHRWVWQGMLRYEGKFKCGGTLITPSLFLTAAHCVKDQDRPLDPKKMKVLMGYHVRAGSTTIGQEGSIQEIKIHADYRDASVSEGMIFNDIALIKLDKPFKLTQYVGCACLPESKSKLPAGTECYLTGWGKLGASKQEASSLQQAEMVLKPLDKCGAQHYALSDDRFCAQGKSGVHVTSCQGDSGGPVVCKINKRWVLTGVVSMGDENCVATTTLPVFTRVAMYIDWINKMAAELGK